MKVMLFGVLIAATALTAHAEELALVGGTVINPADGKTIEHAFIIVDGNTIQSVGSGAAQPNKITTIDCKGKFILPGYIDTHVHFFQSADLFTRPDGVDLTKIRSYADEV